MKIINFYSLSISKFNYLRVFQMIKPLCRNYSTISSFQHKAKNNSIVKLWYLLNAF